jgi:toxin ParE1/3/4
MKVRYTPQARDDIEEIHRKLATANPAAAQRVEDLIRLKISRLSTFPRSGSRTLLANVRRMPLVKWPYTIFYRIVVDENAIDVLRVVHGARVKDLDEVPG